EYEQVESRISELQKKTGGLSDTIELQKGNLSDLEDDIEEMEEEKEELDEKQEEFEELEADLEFGEFIRESIDDARPLMTEILVKEISQEANKIYRQLRGTATEELEWRPDYEIVVKEDGNEKIFEKLSGGEQMSAALAVRLAILELLSDVDLVFLDEPTANLDDEKRRNLVDQLEQLEGFEQLTVISHDDTFESVTQHAITLEKVDGATQVVSQ
ncbi:MAG: SbcC/MukB-like Walker B domain-containing protein, partial [Candidatus Aenigmatarchaeota archaeon]